MSLLTCFCQILSLLVIILWVLVSARTVEKSIRGTLFFAPCVAGYQEEMARKEAKMDIGGIVDSNV